MSEFKVEVTRGGKSWVHKVPVEYSLFNGGEVNLCLPEPLLGEYSKAEDWVEVQAQLQSANSIMALCMLTDALRREHPLAKYGLYLSYVPYARQDRVCNRGEALSIKVFAGIVNSLAFDEVVIADPHSDVTGAVLNNVTGIIDQETLLKHDGALSQSLRNKEYVLISPDAGATKKTEAVSKAFGGVPVVQGFKRRDLATGKLSGFGVNDPNGLLQGATCLIVDDICDGGGTFVGLAHKLKVAGAQTVELYVTHGIFSRGLDHVFAGGIDKVYTTDSFNSGIEHEKLKTIVNLL